MYSLSNKSEHAFIQPSMAAQSLLKSFFNKLDRHFTAIAHAEAGDLAAVKALLEQDKVHQRHPRKAQG